MVAKAAVAPPRGGARGSAGAVVVAAPPGVLRNYALTTIFVLVCAGFTYHYFQVGTLFLSKPICRDGRGALRSSLSVQLISGRVNCFSR